MSNYTQSFVIKVLDEETGEIKPQICSFDAKREKIKQGWCRMYKSYDDVILELNSKLEIAIFFHIRNKFTKEIKEAYINQRQISKKFNSTPATINKIMRKLEKTKFLKKVERSVYRMNPFMFLPYKANGEELQREWLELEKEQK